MSPGRKKIRVNFQRNTRLTDAFLQLKAASHQNAQPGMKQLYVVTAPWEFRALQIKRSSSKLPEGGWGRNHFKKNKLPAWLLTLISATPELEGVAFKVLMENKLYAQPHYHLV